MRPSPDETDFSPAVAPVSPSRTVLPHLHAQPRLVLVTNCYLGWRVMIMEEDGRLGRSNFIDRQPQSTINNQ